MSTPKPDRKGAGPYCAFRNDRDRLWALVSRDLRLILIALLIVSAAPLAPPYLAPLWGMLLRIAH